MRLNHPVTPWRILIEHHAGRLPVWLSPVQVNVLAITQEADDYARQALSSELVRRGARLSQA